MNASKPECVGITKEKENDVKALLRFLTKPSQNYFTNYLRDVTVKEKKAKKVSAKGNAEKVDRKQKKGSND